MSSTASPCSSPSSPTTCAILHKHPARLLQIPNSILDPSQPKPSSLPHPSPSPSLSVSLIQPPLKTPNVYINGLPPYFPEDQLHALTCPYGEVKSVRTFTRRVGERCSGYGFVLFDAVESAERCIEVLKKYKNLHPSFSKQVHKIPGTSYSLSSNIETQNVQGGVSLAGSKTDTEFSFKTRLEKLADTKSTNLYFEGLPLSIDEATLAALVSPYAIKSSRFFQTKLSHPPRIIAFVRLETREAAEEIIERLHGRMVRGWNDPGSRISVRFADSSEQRELRRSERMAREGEISPSRLTIAQASLLNLHGKNLNPPASPSTRSSLPSVLPRPQRRLPSLFGDGEGDGQGLYYQFPAPPSTPCAPVSPPLLQPPLLLPREGDDRYDSLSLESLHGRGSSSDSSVCARAGSEYGGLPSLLARMGHARAGGYTPAEELILQAHSQGRVYPGGAHVDSAEVLGGRKGGVSEGEMFYSASQQQPYRLAQQSLYSYRQQQQQQQQTVTTQFNISKIGHGPNPIQQRTHHISNINNSNSSHRRVLDFEQQYPQLQQHSISSAPSISSNNSNVHQLRIPTAAATAMKILASPNRATPPPLLSNHQRSYYQQHHRRQNDVINYDNDKHTIILPQANQRARKEEGEKNLGESADVPEDVEGSPFFEFNQHHHDDAMKHAGAVHRYNSSHAYDSARFVVQAAVAPAEEMKVAEEVVSPALTYGSTCSRTPSTLSPATPFFGTFGPPSSSQGALGKERDEGEGEGGEGGVLEVVVPHQGERLD